MTDSAALIGTEHDHLTRFLIEGAGVRGVRVQLQDTWSEIRRRMADTVDQAAALELLGEAVAASALFTGHAKVDGRLSMQLRSDGPLRTLFAECSSAGTLRGIVQVDDARGTVSRDLTALGNGAVLAITIENPGRGGREPMRYQGMVALEADSMAAAFEDYFRQSEQLPTRLLLVADEQRVAGLMLQKLPGDEGDDDGWVRAGALFDTLKPAELLDWDTATLLSRLFHEDGAQTLGTSPLRFGCSCSRARVESMVVSLGEEEAMAAVAAGADGKALIRCEFCAESYTLDSDDVRQLLDASQSEIQAPQGLQ